jgi:hypothetical protein
MEKFSAVELATVAAAGRTRGEAMECAPSLDVMKQRRVVVPERYEYGIRLLESVVAMLTKML